MKDYDILKEVGYLYASNFYWHMSENYRALDIMLR